MEPKKKMDQGPAVHCNVFEYCAGRQSGGMRCWELAQVESDFHFVFNVCSDCIVYLYGQENTVMTRQVIEQIILKRQPLLDN